MNPAAAQRREIERRFLVEAPPDLRECASREVRQGYLADRPAVVRVREDGAGKYVLTVKRGPLADREEREIALSREQFEELWPLTAGRRIHKTRYHLPQEQGLIELDCFHGVHEGLVIAEVEFAGREAAARFEPPGWFGREVTDDPAYANVNLAVE